MMWFSHEYRRPGFGISDDLAKLAEGDGNGGAAADRQVVQKHGTRGPLRRLALDINSLCRPIVREIDFDTAFGNSGPTYSLITRLYENFSVNGGTKKTFMKKVAHGEPKCNPLILAVLVSRKTPWNDPLGVSSFHACPPRLTPARLHIYPDSPFRSP